MKKGLKFLLIIILSVFMVNTKVLAASANLSVSSNSVFVGETFTVSVSAKSVAAWNIHTSVSGPVTGCIINEADATSDANDTDKTFTASCKATDIGTITITLSGDVTSSSTGNSIDISGTKNVTVRRISTNNNLSSLKVGNVSVPDFSASKLSYTVTVDSESVNISAVAEDSKSSISGTGNKILKYGRNQFGIKVTAENGSAKTYTVVINRTDNRDTNNYLSSLTVDKGNLKFNKNTTSYTINVDSDIEKITINGTPESSKAKIDGLGQKTLKYGNNKFEIKVTAENETIKTYIVTVNRKDNRDTNNYLSSLSVDKGVLNFNKDTLSYTFEVGKDIEKITIKAIAESSKAKVIGDGEKTLKVGDNKFEIKVTAENETVKTYTIIVKRLEKEENYIKSLTIEDVDFNFDPNVLEYTLSVDDKAKLVFNYELEDGVVASIEGNENLKNGSNIILKLTKGTDTKEYTFNISKQENNPNELVATVKNKKNNKWIIFVVIGAIILGIIGFFSNKKKANKQKTNVSSVIPTPNISDLNNTQRVSIINGEEVQVLEPHDNINSQSNNRIN